jgi:hypothetical protein
MVSSMANHPAVKQSGGEKKRGRPANERPDVPSYRDIAAKTGVSAQTVSYVVRNILKVSSETKARVLAEMGIPHELGGCPHLRAFG